MYTIQPCRLDRFQVLEEVKQIALLHGEFTLRSGQKSNYYLDKYRFESQPALLAKVAELMLDLLPPAKDFDRLAGVELGGIPLVTAVSLATGKPSLFVRAKSKEYGTSKQIEGIFNPEERVVMVEDIVTTGGAALEGVSALRDANLNVVALCAVLNRESGGAEKFAELGVPFFALFNKTEFGV